MIIASAWAQGPNDSKTYYQAADGKSGQALKTAMFNIIKGHTKIGYDGLYEAYKKTDTRPDGYVRDWYSNATNYTHVKDKAGSYGKEGDCYNREHCLPQSWYKGGGNDDYLVCDIVHVLPTDGYVNNRRGNNVLAETKNPSWSSKNGYCRVGMCSVSGYSGQIFEPNDEIKGDIARIYFYVVTCYEGNVSKWANNATASNVFNGQTYQPFKDWYLKMLFEWSQNDPVDDVEIARNNAVYTVQGNRNPFVDYPGLEEYVWGDKKNEPFDYTNYDSGTSTVSAPYFTPAAGTYKSAQQVTINCSTSDVAIYYTLDGSTPTTSSAQYTEPITVAESLTLKAFAVKGDDQSKVATAEYVINEGGDDPTGDGNYQKVTATSDLESGKNYIIVFEGDDAKALTKIDKSNNTGDVTISSATIDMSNASNKAMILVLEKVGNYWTIKGSDGTYMALNSNSNTLDASTSATENNAKWNISISGGTAMIFNVQYSDRKLQYNTSANMFRCYTGSQQDVAIYKEKSTVTGVHAVKTSNGEVGDVIYDLQGRKIDGKSLKSGVYIVNGNKIIVK